MKTVNFKVVGFSRSMSTSKIPRLFLVQFLFIIKSSLTKHPHLAQILPSSCLEQQNSQVSGLTVMKSCFQVLQNHRLGSLSRNSSLAMPETKLLLLVL